MLQLLIKIVLNEVSIMIKELKGIQKFWIAEFMRFANLTSNNLNNTTPYWKVLLMLDYNISGLVHLTSEKLDDNPLFIWYWLQHLVFLYRQVCKFGKDCEVTS